jgi:hypothetical protein
MKFHSWLWNSIAGHSAAWRSAIILAAILLTPGCKSWGKFWCVGERLWNDPTCESERPPKQPQLGGHGPSATTPPEPTTPADLAAANAGGGAIRLTWQASKDDTTPQASMVYEICQTTTSGGCSGGSFSVTYSVTGQTKYTTGTLTNGTTYYFTIRAKDANGLISSVSPQVRATAATTPQWLQTAYLKAPNAEMGDVFGNSVAISGDTIVVGADLEDSNSTAVCNEFTSSACDNAGGDGPNNNGAQGAGAALCL